LLWEKTQFENFDIVYAASKLPTQNDFTPGTLQMFRGVERSILFGVPLNSKELLFQCYFKHKESISSLNQRSLHTIYKDFDPKVKKVFEDMEHDHNNPIFYDTITMVKEPILNKKRVVLLGDTGYCPTFLSGMGASLGMLGGHCLAHFLKKSDPETALNEYNTFMQPILATFQSNARKNTTTAMATSSLSLSLSKLFLKTIPDSIFYKNLGNQFFLPSETLKRNVDYFYLDSIQLLFSSPPILRAVMNLDFETSLIS